jgi:hypothetical protein
MPTRHPLKEPPIVIEKTGSQIASPHRLQAIDALDQAELERLFSRLHAEGLPSLSAIVRGIRRPGCG